jgi:hypothetical protein
MDQELQDKLFEKYPQLFSNRTKSPMESCMSWGIGCNNGWYELLSSLCWRIFQHEKNIEDRKKYLASKNQDIQQDFGIKIEGDEPEEYHPVKFDQVKEKFGGLRVYFTGGDDYVDGVVGMAEEYSYKVCEVCGNAGKPNKGGWITTLCDGCRRMTYEGNS